MVPCGERLLFQSLKFIRVKVHRVVKAGGRAELAAVVKIVICY